jgi:hypothetical protein
MIIAADEDTAGNGGQEEDPGDPMGERYWIEGVVDQEIHVVLGYGTQAVGVILFPAEYASTLVSLPLVLMMM